MMGDQVQPPPPPQQQAPPPEQPQGPPPSPGSMAPDYNVPDRSPEELREEEWERARQERYGEDVRDYDRNIGRNEESDSEYREGYDPIGDRGMGLADSQSEVLDSVIEGGSDRQRDKWNRMYARDGDGEIAGEERQHMYHDMD